MVARTAGACAALVSSLLWVACGRTSVQDLTDGGSGGAPEENVSSGAAADATVGGGAGHESGGSTSSQTLSEFDDCNPLDDECPAGMYCQLWDGRIQCIEEGSTARDAVCEKTDTCERGSICLFGSDLYGKSCQQPCPLDADPWTVCDIGRHTCFVAVDDDENELPFGVCRY